MALSPLLLVVITLCGVVTICILGIRQPRTRYSLPPGPKPLPFLGNLWDIPSKNEAATYHEWAKNYGDLVHASFMGRHFLFVNSAQVAHDLFEKRWSNYSDRNRLPMINELMGWDWSFGHMPFGERWRKHRRMFERQFRAAAAPTYWPVQQKNTHSLLRKIFESPEDLMEHLRRHAGAVIMNAIYGIEISTKADRYIAIAEIALEGISKAAKPGAFLVDVFPCLKYLPGWMPGAGFKKRAAECKRCVLEMRDAPFVAVQKGLVAGIASPCFVTRLLDDLNDAQSTEDQIEVIKGCAGLAYAAGAEGTVSSLSSFFLAMVLKPGVQAKAQAELDSVIGSGRLPDFNDRPSLTYINAVVKEVLRWNPVAPLGFPHMVTKDDIYNGYFIPAGTTVFGNTWTILHDERNYFRPMDFMPERFLNHDGTQNLKVLDPATVAFGYGRRQAICPGRFMAESSIWISIACFLAVFDIRRGKDENGEPIKVKAEFQSGMICHPKPFSYIISPRTETAKAIIKETAILW